MKENTTYLVALEEAANYMREGKDVPMAIIEKAIGKRPAFCDSPDLDSMQEAMHAHNRYRVEEAAFLDAAFHLAKP